LNNKNLIEDKNIKISKISKNSNPKMQADARKCAGGCLPALGSTITYDMIKGPYKNDRAPKA
jgi:hypothetical protein